MLPGVMALRAWRAGVGPRVQLGRKVILGQWEQLVQRGLKATRAIRGPLDHKESAGWQA